MTIDAFCPPVTVRQNQTVPADCCLMGQMDMNMVC